MAPAPRKPPTLAAPPTAYESLQRYISGLKDIAVALADGYRGLGGEPVRAVLGREELAAVRLFDEYVHACADAFYAAHGDGAAAVVDANLVGHHLHTFVNFELHRRKTFWVDPPLAWMLGQTRLDVDGELLRLPFACCAYVFNDPETCALGDALVRADRAVTSRAPVKVVTVYLVQQPDEGGPRGLMVSCYADRLDGGWPYLLGRDLWVEPRARIDQILDSRFPDVANDAVDEVFRSDPLKQLLHLTINAVLYSTSAGVEPVILVPRERSGRSAVGRALPRAERRARDRAARKSSSDEVYFLPGKIDIKQVQQLREVRARGGGGSVLARFLVRGHWRRAAAGWEDQRPRWIEPYWKGPELASVIEREYRLKQ